MRENKENIEGSHHLGKFFYGTGEEEDLNNYWSILRRLIKYLGKLINGRENEPFFFWLIK